MNIPVTLIVQMVVFAIFIWVVMTFIWPIILGAMNEREKKIASGLAAAEEGQRGLSEAKSRADDVIKEARTRALAIESQARTQANQRPLLANASRYGNPKCGSTNAGCICRRSENARTSASNASHRPELASIARRPRP